MATTYGSPVSLKGPKGDPGLAGTNGIAGKDGKDGVDGAAGAVGPIGVLTGNGDPVASQTDGVDGQAYLDLASGALYIHQGGAWTPTGKTLKGADGLRGSQILVGQGAPSSAVLSAAKGGDLYIDEAGPTFYPLTSDGGQTTASQYLPAGSAQAGTILSPLFAGYVSAPALSPTGGDLTWFVLAPGVSRFAVCPTSGSLRAATVGGYTDDAPVQVQIFKNGSFWLNFQQMMPGGTAGQSIATAGISFGSAEYTVNANDTVQLAAISATDQPANNPILQAELYFAFDAVIPSPQPGQ